MSLTSDDLFEDSELPDDKPFFQKCWAAIAYSYTAEVRVSNEDQTEEESWFDQTEPGLYDKIHNDVVGQFQCISSRSKPRKNYFERFTFPLTESRNAIVVFVTVPLKPLMCTTARLGILHHTAGFDYFNNKLNVFMQCFGSAEDNYAASLHDLKRLRVIRMEDDTAQVNTTNPLKVTKEFLIQFHSDVLASPYAFLCPNNDKQPISKLFLSMTDRTETRMKMRIELPLSQRADRASTKAKGSFFPSSRPSTMPQSLSSSKLWMQMMQEPDPIETDREKLEAYLVNKFLARMIYLASVVRYLRNEAAGLGISHHPLFLCVLMFLIFGFICMAEVFTILSWINYDFRNLFKHMFIILIFLTFQIVVLCILVKEFGFNTAYVRGLTRKWQDTSDSSRMCYCCSSCNLSNVMPIVAVILLIILTIILSLDIARNRNPLPLFMSVLLIFLAAIFSTDRKSIPWITVICLYSSAYSILTAYVRWDRSAVAFLSADFMSAFKRGSQIMANMIYTNKPTFMLQACGMALPVYFLMELSILLDHFTLIFYLSKPLSKCLQLTWIEISYACASNTLTYRQMIHLNSNMVRLLTDSELCLFLSLNFTGSNLIWACCFHVLGIPFQLYVLLIVVTLPCVMAFSKVMYPESQKSLTSHRGLFTRHPPAVSSIQLLTHVWIGSIGGCIRFIAVQFLTFLSLKIALSVIIYFFNTATVQTLRSLPRIFSSMIWPLIWACGVTNPKDAARIAEMFLTRIFMNNLGSAMQFSTSLSLRWLEDCRRTENVRNYGLQTNVTEIFEYFEEIPLSHHSLFMGIPFVMSGGSITAAVMVATEVCSINRDRDLKRILRITVRSFVISLMTTFFAACIIGNVISLWGTSKIECTAQIVAEQAGSKSFCKHYYLIADERFQKREKEAQPLKYDTFLFLEDACFSLFPDDIL